MIAFGEDAHRLRYSRDLSGTNLASALKLRVEVVALGLQVPQELDVRSTLVACEIEVFLGIGNAPFG